MFDLHNEGPANSNLRPIGGPWSLFSRLRILCGGQLVEDISEYASIHEMFSILGSEGARENDYSEGFSNYWERLVDSDSLHTRFLRGIPSGQSMTVVFKPLCGLLRQQKYLPIRYMPITIELSLTDDATSPIISHATHYTSPNDVNNFTDANASLLWSILNVQAKM